VHAFNVPGDVHFLLGPVIAERTLELRVFAAFPFLVVAQRALQFVVSAAAWTLHAAAGARRTAAAASASAVPDAAAARVADLQRVIGRGVRVELTVVVVVGELEIDGGHRAVRAERVEQRHDGPLRWRVVPAVPVFAAVLPSFYYFCKGSEQQT